MVIFSSANRIAGRNYETKILS